MKLLKLKQYLEVKDMKPGKKSKLYYGIVKAIEDGMHIPFSVKDVNDKADKLLDKSPAFLSKHAKGNPGGYSELFIRVEKGKYKLNR